MVPGNEGLCLFMSAMILKWLSFQKCKNIPLHKRGSVFFSRWNCRVNRVPHSLYGKVQICSLFSKHRSMNILNIRVIVAACNYFLGNAHQDVSNTDTFKCF